MIKFYIWILFKYILIIISRNSDPKNLRSLITCCFCRINFSRERKSILNIFEYLLINLRHIHSRSSGQTSFKFVQENSPTGLEIIHHNSWPLFICIIPYLSQWPPQCNLISRVVLVQCLFFVVSSQIFRHLQPFS